MELRLCTVIVQISHGLEQRKLCICVFSVGIHKVRSFICDIQTGHCETTWSIAPRTNPTSPGLYTSVQSPPKDSTDWSVTSNNKTSKHLVPVLPSVRPVDLQSCSTRFPLCGLQTSCPSSHKGLLKLTKVHHWPTATCRISELTFSGAGVTERNNTTANCEEQRVNGLYPAVRLHCKVLILHRIYNSLSLAHSLQTYW